MPTRPTLINLARDLITKAISVPASSRAFNPNLQAVTRTVTRAGRSFPMRVYIRRPDAEDQDTARAATPPAPYQAAVNAAADLLALDGDAIEVHDPRENITMHIENIGGHYVATLRDDNTGITYPNNTVLDDAYSAVAYAHDTLGVTPSDASWEPIVPQPDIVVYDADAAEGITAPATTTIGRDTPILIDPQDGDAPTPTTLSAFLEDNDGADDEEWLGEIVRDLSSTGQYRGGGGAGASYTLTLQGGDGAPPRDGGDVPMPDDLPNPADYDRVERWTDEHGTYLMLWDEDSEGPSLMFPNEAASEAWLLRQGLVDSGQESGLDGHPLWDWRGDPRSSDTEVISLTYIGD